MKEIPLTQGKVAIIDNEDFDLVSAFKWRTRRHCGLLYAKTGGFGGRDLVMHQLICGNILPGFVIDHINGNGLDNRRFNLRIVPQSINRMSSKISKNNTSGFKGVVRTKQGRWASSLQYRENGKIVKKYLGTYVTPQEASEAYISAVYARYGFFYSRGW